MASVTLVVSRKPRSKTIATPEIVPLGYASFGKPISSVKSISDNEHTPTPKRSSVINTLAKKSARGSGTIGVTLNAVVGLVVTSAIVIIKIACPILRQTPRFNPSRSYATRTDSSLSIAKSSSVF